MVALSNCKIERIFMVVHFHLQNWATFSAFALCALGGWVRGGTYGDMHVSLRLCVLVQQKQLGNEPPGKNNNSKINTSVPVHSNAILSSNWIM